jgi:hypothetical protein
VQGVANAAYLGDFLCSGLLSVAPYCVPGDIRVVSEAGGRKLSYLLASEIWKAAVSE